MTWSANERQGEANCRDAMEQLFALLDGALTSEQERRLRNHITSCPDCFTTADFEKRFLEALHTLKEEDRVPVACRTKVLAALRAAGFTG